ncbi:uncharacterized protein K452DRAFT_358520 [Aplosporella prunicola CBS 121167]|uniref:SET domain-containing protein n=1 Tax=Aplosporella prunicola CBS 121167 TaxID=1176127 RepID=A0A6A6BCX1_9PEZI|nr:uncharacterized protein K452DRAFT_358520 [Aplosporella prunicola CBS 121167]KAF2142052.1 hypothetical protein K452DRAFT_358520 [Aplosporella prunicola CBS 121167]
MESHFESSPQGIDDALHNLMRCLSSYNPEGDLAEKMGDMNLEDADAGGPLATDALLERLDRARTRVLACPYSISCRLQVAELYRALGYPDLAAGEAYRVLLLVDEVLDDSGEYHDQALETAIEELSSKSAILREEYAAAQTAQYPDVAKQLASCKVAEETSHMEASEDEVTMWTETLWAKAAYIYVASNLFACGCIKSAYEFCLRGLKSTPDNVHLLLLRKMLDRRLRTYFESRGASLDDEDITIEDYPERTCVRRELYAWNDREPDRYSPDSLALLNKQISKIAPKLEARITELPLLVSDTDGAATSKESGPTTIKQLGVFVKQDIPPGEVILNEKSLLTANARLHDSYCDACSAALPDLQGSNASQCAFCDECDDIVFCSKECHELAQDSYHPAVCGADVEAIAKDAPATEAADALYALLLLRALAMAENQDTHPLDLHEVKYIWGDYYIPPSGEAIRLGSVPLGPQHDSFGGMPQTLPFTFSTNILVPLHMLEKMDVNIFETSDKYDFWVFNTLYAKFRGTASARQGRDGKPDVGAVHPLWCLANHSCDPNVAWEWAGNMRFWARKERVQWEGKEGKKEPGLNKDEEVLSHYCDIELPVNERREWAVGALGDARGKKKFRHAYRRRA